MDKETNADVLKDKIRINTLTKMIMISAGEPSTIESLFRNNRGHAGLVVTTFVKGYLRLLYLEAKYAFKKKEPKYFKAGTIGVCTLPFHLFHVIRFFLKIRKVGKQ